MAATVKAMAGTLRHRGPDDEGTWVDCSAGIALGHRRLAIVDLSPAGHQPMVSQSGRYVLVYNGEIYNHGELRQELEQLGHRFRGHSDSEVLLESCAEWGIGRAIERLSGMFSIGLWDRETRSLTLLRDRLGIKPLYWAQFEHFFIFGSELKALRAHTGWQPEIDRDSIAAYLRHQYIPAPYSVFKGVFKLPAGHMLTVLPSGQCETRRYWDLREIARGAQARREELSEAEAKERLESLLIDAVQHHMIADVPLGAFLSGGIDSSTVVALMQAQSRRAVKTYAIGFTDAAYNEAPYAKAVAHHLRTEHTELYVEPRDVSDIIPTLHECYDEPFADPSQVPTILLSRLARKHLAVALSGDGGDEVFGGYKRYYRAERLWRRLQWMPEVARRGAGACFRGLALRSRALGGVIPQKWQSRFIGEKLNRLSDRVTAPDELAFYRSIVSQISDPADFVLAADEHKGILWDKSIVDDIPNAMERMGYLDTVTSLPDQMLTKVDRASMAVSLEVRVPLLDHHLVEFTWRLPPTLKFQTQDENKRLLRAILYKYVPPSLVNRRKRGFGAPIAAWLRGPLMEWAEDLLSKRRLEEAGIFDASIVREIWEEQLAAVGNWERVLWRILMFQAWNVPLFSGRDLITTPTR